MSEKINIPDQEDILATNERLTAENRRLTAELTAASELLDTAQKQGTEATQRADALANRVSTLEIAAKTAGEELARVKGENAELTAKMADFNKAVAAEVLKLGLNPKAASHKETPSDADLTPTQRVLAAKGVRSIAELKPQS
jgi:predicted  nucleic acid-binding Zn-ribbon protein